MNVSDILKLLGTLSIGLDEPSASDIVVYMRFINLCYTEIIQSTIAQNPLVPILNESVDCINGNLAATSQPIFKPISIYNLTSNTSMIGAVYSDILKRDPSLSLTGIAQNWYYSGGVISVYPLMTTLLIDGGGFGIRYIPQPAPLTANSLSADILIPPLYQQVLADGASYYLFQSETGFKDQLKMQAAMARWQEGKQKLFAYMKNISGNQNLSTFSYV